MKKISLILAVELIIMLTGYFSPGARAQLVNLRCPMFSDDGRSMGEDSITINGGGEGATLVHTIPGQMQGFKIVGPNGLRTGGSVPWRGWYVHRLSICNRCIVQFRQSMQGSRRHAEVAL